MNVNGRMFHIVGANLISRAIVKRFIKRNQMMGEVMNEMRVVPDHQELFKGVESDAFADFAIIAGDLHYAINNTF